LLNKEFEAVFKFQLNQPSKAVFKKRSLAQYGASIDVKGIKAMRIKFSFLLLIFIFLTGCVQSINLKQAEIHYNAGSQYEDKGDFISAKEQFAKALSDARLGKAKPAAISMLTYNLGRVTGYACDFEQSEKLLIEALKLEEKVTGPSSGITTMRLFELARLNYDQGKYAEAAKYYSRGLPLVEALNVIESDPITFANALDEYSRALEETGNIDESIKIKTKSKKIKESNSEREVVLVPKRYRCNG